MEHNNEKELLSDVVAYLNRQILDLLACRWLDLYTVIKV